MERTDLPNAAAQQARKVGVRLTSTYTFLACMGGAPLHAPLTQFLQYFLFYLTKMLLKRLPVSNFYHLDVLGSSLAPFSLTLHSPTSHIQFRHASLQESLSLTTLSAHKILTPERLAILHLIHTCDQPFSPAQITAALDLDYTCVRQVLSKMVKANLLTIVSHGHYTFHPFIKPLVPELLAEHPCQFKFETAHILLTSDSADTSTPETSPNDPSNTAQTPDTTANLASQTRIAHNLTPHSYPLLAPQTKNISPNQPGTI